MKHGAPTHSGDIIVILIIAFIIGDTRRMRVRPSGDQVVIAQLNFVVAREVTVVFCIVKREKDTMHPLINRPLSRFRMLKYVRLETKITPDKHCTYVVG